LLVDHPRLPVVGHVCCGWFEGFRFHLR
jgi:hypothetical protein